MSTLNKICIISASGCRKNNFNKRKRIYIIDCINKCKPKYLKIFKNRKLLNKWLISEKEHLSK